MINLNNKILVIFLVFVESFARAVCFVVLLEILNFAERINICNIVFQSMGKDQTVLFHSSVFGPIRSRRLGVSLGINLSPDDGKVCSFDCLYCEAGFNSQGAGTTRLPLRERLYDQLESKLRQMKEERENLDVITFSGNGEPTLHPDFEAITDDVIALRDKYFPTAKVSVLTNATRLGNESVVRALRRVDNNILKLDSAIEQTMRIIDRPSQPDFSVTRVVNELKQFAGTGIIQTMLLRGEYDGQKIDNTTEAEISALINAYKEINPRSVMLYSIDRSTPAEKLVKVEKDELEQIARKLRQAGLEVSVSA